MSYYLKFSTNHVNINNGFIPVINSTKSILKSKKECIYLFKHLSIDIDDLVFISDCKNKQIDQVVLVDHNELDEQQKSMGFSGLVKAIVDHHLDKNEYQNAQPRLIDTKVGSNSTLIANLFYKSNIKLDESFASMLLFPILSDTNNLKMRTSQLDLEMCEYLNNICHMDLEAIYKMIDICKYDQTDMDTNTLLKADYKV
jgi:inorganic pyrophosphatase/exopolyphosphatase